MKLSRQLLPVVFVLLAGWAGPGRPADEKSEVKEKAFDVPGGTIVKVRMEGPYTADVPLQAVCYFRYTPERAKKMTGAPVELDKMLGGVIASLRERGEFLGDEGETILLIPPLDSIKAKSLLLVGLGEEDALSLNVLERVGKTVLREAARLGVSRVAYAPLIRDQGNSKFGTGDVANAVIRGALLALDTQKRLHNEGISKPFTLEQWNVEAGPAFFDETVAGVQKGIEEAMAQIDKRSSEPYSSGKK